jgi:hypothetical protein|uniref:RIIa domain-containing protein n=1 Tax=Eutreptiella gymnastica TaxID=73025 RepID=A0A7S4G2G0_9EUGL|eukprot:CAMPEP_0174296230 /NCGR_PEP_ID=MMETSP0809-20121228/47237_1 /TAXON_ID=73025 ORGANISM="Eutreptiella gymnastica-like, Strain CCMP1594" /NCGR_SAMPLE_ID=MMETSP0809 /ASSEMBLY_ACC=CAM_ASM_000658 /LENGTH=198 /DNA_ID=CAMNT_0015399073 /DNA_START=56 /DNA_END=652 /DNA_ORIENTATION=+
MDNNVMYCAEQIKIPLELGTVLKQFTKAVILEEPKDLYKWSSNYFAQLANLPAAFGPNGEYLDGVMHDLKHKPGAAAAPQPDDSQAPGAEPQQETMEQHGQVEEEGGMGKSQEAEQEAEQADVVNEIFTRYNTEDGRIHQDTVSLIFGELQEKLNFEMTEDDYSQYMNMLAPDEEGFCNIADVYNLFFQQEEGEEEEA